MIGMEASHDTMTAVRSRVRDESHSHSMMAMSVTRNDKDQFESERSRYAERRSSYDKSVWPVGKGTRQDGLGAPAIGIRMRVIGGGPPSLAPIFFGISTHHQRTDVVTRNKPMRHGHFSRGVIHVE